MTDQHHETEEFTMRAMTGLINATLLSLPIWGIIVYGISLIA